MRKVHTKSDVFVPFAYFLFVQGGNMQQKACKFQFQIIGQMQNLEILHNYMTYP